MGAYLDGGIIMDGVTNDGTDTTVYSNAFSTSRADVWSVHLEGASVSSYSAAITLWASNKLEPGTADDTDWVQMTSTHGWDGFPSGDPSAASSLKDLIDVGVSGALWYRFKFVRSAGSANLTVILNRKGRER